jgi:hypothetical protein
MIVRWRDMIDVQVVWDRKAKAYRATADELPDGVGYGRTREEAIADLEPHLVAWCEMFEALAEAKSVAPVLKTTIRTYLSQSAAPAYNEILEEVFGKFAVGEHPQTRQMCFLLGHLESFTPEFFARLRMEVVGQFPRWSVLAQFETAKVGVNSDGLSFDDGPEIRGPVNGAHSEYAAWTSRARQLRERLWGPRWRQLQEVAKRLPRVLSSLDSKAAIVAGVFDQWEPNFPGFPVWIFQRSSQEFDMGDATCFRRSGVTPNGTILPARGPLARDPSENGPWLCTFVLDEPPVGNLDLTTEDGDVVASLEPGSVTSDQELKERFGTLD